MKYIINEEDKLYYNNDLILSNKEVEKAIDITNKAIKELDEATNKFDINIFEILGLRNLSGTVGEYFSKCVEIISNEQLYSNPHQDGYPDLLDNRKPEMKKFLYEIIGDKAKGFAKESFSNYYYGGIEVKATCGSTPTAKTHRKPLVGEQRIEILKGFDWKAHHRETNNLLGIVWDFIEGIPVITACFYSNELIEDDWGKIVKPQNGGGRTTSVSVMKTSGIKKMCTNWIAIIDNPIYTQIFSKKKWVGYDVKHME